MRKFQGIAGSVRRRNCGGVNNWPATHLGTDIFSPRGGNYMPTSSVKGQAGRDDHMPSAWPARQQATSCGPVVGRGAGTFGSAGKGGGDHYRRRQSPDRRRNCALLFSCLLRRTL